jgi:hypothetical protein
VAAVWLDVTSAVATFSYFSKRQKNSDVTFQIFRLCLLLLVSILCVIWIVFSAKWQNSPLVSSISIPIPRGSLPTYRS